MEPAPPPPRAEEEEEQVCVCHVEDAVTFWAQSLSRGAELAALSDQLAQLCPLLAPAFGELDLGRLHGGLFSEDQLWYRCRVLQGLAGDHKCQVLYVDYGNSELLSRASLVELPEQLQQAALATKYRLWGLQLSDPDISLAQQGTTFLVNMIHEKLITVRHRATYKDGTQIVQAEFHDLDIGDEVAKKGFALRCKSVPSPSGGEGRKKDSLASQARPRTPSTSTALWRAHIERSPSGDHKSPPRPCVLPSHCDTWSRSSKTSDGNNNFTSLSLSPTLSKKREEMLLEENKTLKYERDHALDKCKSLESQVERLHLDLKMEKEKADERYRALEKNLQSAIGDKLRGLAPKIAFLKGARSENKNFSFDNELSDAVRVVSEESINAPSCFRKLEDIWKEYKLAQQNIQLCGDTGEIVGLIAKRNDTQQTLISAVEEFILEVDELSLSHRTKVLQNLFSSLEAIYGEAFQNDVSDQTFHDFYEWKESKISMLRSVRSNTDESLKVLFEWFTKLQQFFDLVSVTRSTSEEVVGNIDEILKTFESDISKELEIYTAKPNENDEKIISSTYSKVLAEIRKEQELIKVVFRKHADSCEFRRQMSDCLNSSPSVDKLLTIKKTLKTLKTQLRWKTIEQRSLEESEEVSKVDVQSKKEALSELRMKMFDEIYREQREYEKLSCLVENWFPEMMMLHPEAGLEKYKISGGLLSVTLERDLFDAVPLKGLSSKRPLVCAEMCGQKVLLKGYSLGVDTEAKVTERAARYHQAWSELKEESGLLQLLFIFFCKSDPLAYLIVPFYSGESLGEIQANKPLTPQEVAKVMKGIACGLQALHKANIVHGSVNQNNTFAVSRKKGILGDFDFTKTQEERSLLNSVGSLNFTAPEVKSGGLVSPLSDMYSYGCLLLWLSTAEGYYRRKPGGIPDIDELGVSSSLKSLLSGLISVTDRKSAAKVVEEEYFCMQDVKVKDASLCVLEKDIEDVHLICDSQMAHIEPSLSTSRNSEEN